MTLKIFLAELTQQVQDVIQSSASLRFPENIDEHFANLDPEIQGGGVLANHLTERESLHVIVLEVGPADPDTAAILGIYDHLINNSRNWRFNTMSQNNSCPTLVLNKICRFSRGKALRDRSELNAAIYVKGNRREYDRWTLMVGSKSWSYDALLPYFPKFENSCALHPKRRKEVVPGINGPQRVNPAPPVPGLINDVIEGFENLSYKVVDYNGRSHKGCGMVQSYSNYNTRAGSN
ncbi:glucose dehydrogenase [FAD, quinone]-like [Euwallacea fornicatus]|uniref:glucose dehydrogenase [FAD, quinone]-like n=1 Tax=Euwallacea fornicatus TaxID=995702 RepID=UPI003390775D